MPKVRSYESFQNFGKSEQWTLSLDYFVELHNQQAQELNLSTTALKLQNVSMSVTSEQEKRDGMLPDFSKCQSSVHGSVVKAIHQRVWRVVSFS